jgi:peptide/nickel transport system ATP-binding protein/oligopeptide transport system ATP-binding protein
MSAAPILEVRNLSKTFTVRRSVLGRPLTTVRAVDGVSLHLQPGETLALVGESGCGKSTLGRTIMRLVDPTEGRVTLGGTDITALSERAFQPFRRQIQLIFQDPHGSLNPRMTVGQIVAEPLMLHDIVPAADRSGRVRELLAACGLARQHAGRFPHELSGGQRQRVAIARALASEPSVIVCDEAVSALDVSVRSQILNLLKDLQQRLGIGYIFISHDLAVVKHIADRIAVMYLGRIVETGPAADVFADPRHPYTRALLSAIPIAEPRARPTRPIDGDIPSAVKPPPGCHFNPRCPYAEAVCRTSRPLLAGNDGHTAACHFWPTLPSAAGILPVPRPPDPRLEKLLAAFTKPALEAAS